MPDDKTPRPYRRDDRRFLFRRRGSATIPTEQAKSEPRQPAMPAVRTLLDMAAPPASSPLPLIGSPNGVIREWELGEYGVLMTESGVLYSLDPIAYRVWRLHRRGEPLLELASTVAADCDIEPERALAVTAHLLDRLRGTFCTERT